MLTDEKKKMMAGILKAQPDVVAAYLFGSQHHGYADKGSDIDVGVIFADDQIGLKRELGLASQISRVIDQEVDVRSLDLRKSPVFLMEAVQGELLTGHDRPERVAFEMALSKLNDDCQHYFRISRHYV